MKAVAGEEMAWVLVGLCSLYPYWVPSLASVCERGGIRVGINDDDDTGVQSTALKMISVEIPQSSQTRMIGHPA